MTPELGLIIAQTLLRYGPAIALDIATLFSKKEHSLDDWKAIFEKVKTYDQIMQPAA
jgi:hypothetical protein